MTGSHQPIPDSQSPRKLDAVAVAGGRLLAPLLRALRMPYFGRLSVILSLVALLVIAVLIGHSAVA